MQKISEIAAADFFFAFNDEMQIHRQIALLLERFLNAENVREDLALVVRRTARKDVAIFQDRLERRRFPQLERIGRLHIVVTVNQNGAPAFLMFVLRPNNRMTRSRNQASLRGRRLFSFSTSQCAHSFSFSE